MLVGCPTMIYIAINTQNPIQLSYKANVFQEATGEGLEECASRALDSQSKPEWAKAGIDCTGTLTG